MRQRQQREISSRIQASIAIFIISLLLSPSLSLSASAQPQAAPAEVRQLEPGKPIERQLKASETHIYEIALAVNQYLQAVVNQKGIDVVVQVLAPDGKPLLEVDSPNGTDGAEPVQLIATVSGRYQLKVSSLEKNAPAGRYEIRLLAWRTATDNDRAAIENERAVKEADELQTEAEKLRGAGKYDAALPLAQRALSLKEKALGATHPDTALSVSYLGLIYYFKADYDKAEPLMLRALAIYETAHGTEHPYTASELNNLASVYDAKGEYDRAEPLYLRALAIREKVLGKEHTATATTLNNLAELYRVKGDYDKAEPLYLRSLAIREKTFGAEHLSVAYAINNLAALHNATADYAKAEPLYLRALTIFEKTAGKDHPLTLTALNNVAAVYRNKGEYDKAEPLYLRILATREKGLGADHPETGVALNNLAGLYRQKGEYAKAEPLFVRALAIYEKSLAAEHPLTIITLNNLAALNQAMDNFPQAIALQNRCNEAAERDFIRNLAAGSERQRLIYLNQTARYLDLTLTLHTQFAPTDLLARQMAMRVLLQRKGRALDVSADILAALRRHAAPDDQKLLDQLTNARSQLSNGILKGAGRDGIATHRQRLKGFVEEIEKLEAELSRRSADFRAQALPVTLEAVQAAVPDDAALIEFAAFRPYDAKAQKLGASRYAAYLLTGSGEVQWADLGAAATIDQAVKEFRDLLRRSSSNITREVMPKARALDELVMRPLRSLIGTKKRLLISPDGALNLIPFEALVDEQQRYLVQNYSISYLTSGRDLLRLQVAKPNHKTALLIADPDFDNGATGEKATAADSRIATRIEPTENGKERIAHRVDKRPGPKLGDAQLQPFGRLRGSAKEGKKLKQLLPGATLLTAADATETALKHAVSPAILHISTHGGFMEENPLSAADERGLMVVRENYSDAVPTLKVADPFLRSGLFFAGANTGGTRDDDGVLTALEAKNLDLYDTKLVVLSACDTGVGEVKNGDGVYGLRRALVLAGSETQVMSLWAVSDEGTRKLMVAYYKRLLKGEGRGEALRQVRLEMLSSKKRQHPYYWASFIQSGEWANLDGK